MWGEVASLSAFFFHFILMNAALRNFSSFSMRWSMLLLVCWCGVVVFLFVMVTAIMNMLITMVYYELWSYNLMSYLHSGVSARPVIFCYIWRQNHFQTFVVIPWIFIKDEKPSFNLMERSGYAFVWGGTEWVNILLNPNRKIPSDEFS